MRVPDSLKQTVCFLAVKPPEGDIVKYQFGGTGVFISIPGEDEPRLAHVYLVTAKHSIEKASRIGDLYVRLNFIPDNTDFVKDGEAEFVPLSSDGWIYPEDEAIDIAIRHFGLLQEEVNHLAIPKSVFATEDKLRAFNVGIGDDIFVLGLFSHREGRHKNIPIVRSGNIAAMPEEPLIDENSGLPYNAYLIEVRSIGGLSGSPVFASRGRGLYNATAATAIMSPGLLGLIRGHWDLRTQKSLVGYAGDEALTVNTGIAMVTPIHEVLNLLESPDLKKYRRSQEKEWLNKYSHLLASEAEQNN